MHPGCHDITGHLENQLCWIFLEWPDGVYSLLSGSFNLAIHSSPKSWWLFYYYQYNYFLLAHITPPESFMVEIWDDWRRGCSWGEIQPKDNVCARRWHLSAAGASGTDAAPVVCLRADALPGLPRAARLHQRLQLHWRAPQTAHRPGCGDKGQLQQGGADWTSGCQLAPQQNRHSVSWNSLTITVTSKLMHHQTIIASLAFCRLGLTYWLGLTHSTFLTVFL